MKVYRAKSKVTGSLRYGVDYVDHLGVRRKRIVADTKKDAERILAKIRVELETDEYYDRKKRVEKTVDEVISEYKDFFRGKDSYRTECGMLRGIEEYFKGRKVSSILPRDVEEFQRYRLTIPSRRGGKKNPDLRRSEATVNREIECLRRMLNKAIEWGYLRQNPVNSDILFEEPKDRISYLSVEEAGALLRSATGGKNPLLHAIIMTALETGMRKGEILSMDWEAVDLVRRTIHIPVTKTDRPRNVPVSRRLFETLSAIPRQLGSNQVFASREGRAVHDIRKSFDTACRKAGIRATFDFHDLRHTFVTHCLDGGVPIHVVAKIVGHSTAQMTERYGHLIKGREHEAVERLPAWGTPVATPSENPPGESLSSAELEEFWKISV